MTDADDLAERLYVLESKDEIRRLMAAYGHTRDVTGHSVAEYFTAGAVREGTGRLADVLGRHEGQSAIVAFAGPTPPTLHLLANESISVDSAEAVGCWTYLQPSVLNGRAFWIAARYHNDFHRHDGIWRIRHMRIQPLFEASYEDGWAQARFFGGRALRLRGRPGASALRP